MVADIPILLIIFNRPETEEMVIDKLRQIKPKRIYIAADGPRSNVARDADRCRLARKMAEEKIGWDCKVFKLYRDGNLGCGNSVSSAITWFFQNEEMGIVLEDDCCPDLSFFKFCEIGLKRYKNDEKVMMISGTNHQFNKLTMKNDAYFSKLFPVWGWATWKRAWQKYDINMIDWKQDVDKNRLKKICDDTEIFNYYKSIFSYFDDNHIDTWDIQWSCSCLYNDGLCLVSKNNLISNLGYMGTHSKNKDKFHEMPTKPINRDIQLPRQIKHNIAVDKKELFVIKEKERLEMTVSKLVGKLLYLAIIKTKWILGMK